MVHRFIAQLLQRYFADYCRKHITSLHSLNPSRHVHESTLITCIYECALRAWMYIEYTLYTQARAHPTPHPIHMNRIYEDWMYSNFYFKKSSELAVALRCKDVKKYVIPFKSGKINLLDKHFFQSKAAAQGICVVATH